MASSYPSIRFLGCTVLDAGVRRSGLCGYEIICSRDTGVCRRVGVPILHVRGFLSSPFFSGFYPAFTFPPLHPSFSLTRTRPTLPPARLFYPFRHSDIPPDYLPCFPSPSAAPIIHPLARLNSRIETHRTRTFPPRARKVKITSARAWLSLLFTAFYCIC